MKRANLVVAGVCAGVLGLASCTNQFNAPPEAVISCKSDADCPSGWWCSKIAEICITADDTTAPEVTVKRMAPRVLNKRSVLTVEFELSEPQTTRGDPTVRIDGLEISFDKSAIVGSEDRKTWTASYPVNGTEKQDKGYRLVIDVEDRFGNQGGTSPADLVRFDFEPPSVTDVVLSGSPARAGGQVRLEFTASEDLSDKSTVVATIGEKPLTFVRDPAVKAPKHAFVLAADQVVAAATPSEVEGTVSVTARDLAENEITVGQDAEGQPLTVRFDTRPPTLNSAQVLVQYGTREYAHAREASTVTLRMVVSEALSGPPTVTLGGEPMNLAQAEGTLFVYSLTVPGLSGTHSSSFPVTFAVSFADAAGNPGGRACQAGATCTLSPLTTAEGAVVEVTYDPVPLDVVDETVVRRYRAGGTVEVLFSVSKLLPVDADHLVVQVGESSEDRLTCEVRTDAGDAGVGVGYRCVLGLDDEARQARLAGTAPLTVEVTDLAGRNKRVPLGSLVFDFTPPVASLSAIPVGRPAHRGETLAVELSGSEPMEAFTVDPPGFLDLPVVGSGTRAVFSRQIAEEEGAQEFTFGAKDLAGNPAVSATCAGVDGGCPLTLTVRYDGIAPRVKEGFVLEPSSVRAGGEFFFAFASSEALAAAPRVTYSNNVDSVPDAGGLDWPMEPVPDGGVLPPALQPGDGGGFPFVFRANAPSTGSSQYYTVTVAMADRAENPGIWSMTQPLIVDNTPPKLAGFQVTPESAKLNDRVRVVLTADERMRGAPMTLVARTPAPVPPAAGTNYHIDFGRLDLQDDKASYAYEGLVDATLASGTYTFDSFTLADIAGNASPPVDPQKDLKIITVDNVPPEVLAPIAVRNGDTHQPATRFSTAAGFNKLEVEFQVSEEVGLSNLTVAIGADTLACTLETPGAPATYRCTATLPFPKDPSAGLKTVQVTARDAAGNMGTGSAVVEFDFTAPTAVASVQPELAPLGSMLTYSVAASEPLAATPVPQLAVQGVAGWSAAVVSGTTARWTRMVTETDAPGLHPATVTGLCDLVGNCLATLSGVPVEIDNVLPTTAGPVVVTVTAGGTTWKKARSGAKVTAAFSVSEALSGLPVVTLGGEPMTCVSSGGLSFTCERTVVAGTDAEGAAGLLAVMTDPAGNRGSANLGTALLDFTPPALQSSGATPSAARLGSVIAYSVTASEPLSAVPTLTATHSGGSTLAFAALAGTSYLFNHTVGASAANGTYTVSLGLSDEAGNTTTAPGTSFTVDATVPVLSAVSVTPTRASAVAGYSRITVAFDVSETVTVEVKVGGRAATCPAPAGLHYGCTFDVSSSLDTEGLREVSLLVSDAAGNQAGDRRTVELDFTAPSLVGSGASPAVAKLGADIAYSLTASEALLSTPAPVFKRSGGTETLAFTHLPGTTYAYTHAVGTGDANGTYLPTFVLTDTVGNASATLTGDPVQIDSSVPVISAVTLAGGTGGRYSAQTGFKTVTLTFNVSEAIAAANLAVAIGGRAMTCGAFQAAVPNVTCSYPVGGDEGEGNKAVAIEATDAAGNTGYGSAAAFFDFTAPTLLSSGANPAAAGLGAGILYAVSVSEPLSATPTPSFKRTAGVETLAFTHVAGTTYSWRRTVAAGDANGAYAPTMSLVDLVGNSSTQTGTAFSVDSVVPVISNVQALGGASGRYSAQAAYRAMTLTFDVSEAIAAGRVSASLANGSGSLALTCGAWQAASPNVSCSYPVTGGEVAGNKAVSIVATDAAGNAGYGSTSVVFDFSPPALLSTTVTPSTAGLGADVAYTVTASEPLGAPPAPVFGRVGGGGSLTFAYDTGSTYTWRHPVVAADANGTYAPSFTLTDMVGNTSAVFDRLSPQVQSFQVDATVPAISSITLAGGASGRYSAQAGFNTVTLGFNVSESITPANLTVTLANGAAGLSLTCGAWQAATPNVTCTRPVSGTESTGAKAISIEARDAAGNTGYGSTSVFFDFTAPELLSSGANPPNAALGADIAYSLTASEPLLSTPTPVFNRSGGGAPLAFTFKSGTTYTWTRAVAAGDSGTYAPSLTLTDSVGNVSTALTGASFQVDSVVPVVSGITFAGGAGGRYSAHASYRALSVSFNVSESIDASRLSVLLANGTSNLTLTCSPWQAATPNVTCTYTVLGTEQEGTRALSIEATDAAGNTGYGSDAVVFDFTPPSLASSGAVPTVAAVGTDVAYSVSASEALLSAPVPVFNRTGGGTMAFNYQSGTTYTWRHPVVAGDLSGTYAPTLALTDVVGNASASLVGTAFSVDSVPPAITNVALSGGSNGRYSARAGYDLVTLSFNTGEPIAAGKLSVTLADGDGPLAMSCGPWQATTPNVTCTYDVDGSEDPDSKAISIVATDGAGNAGYGSASVFFDFTAPTLLGTTVSPTSAKLGTDVSYTFSVSEPLLATPSPVFGRVGGGGSLAFSFVNGTTYTWHRTIVAGDGNGNYAPAFALTDAVGNPSVAYDSNHGLVKTFAVDSTIPTLSALTTPGGGRYSARPGYNVVTLTFNTSEQLGGVPGGTVAARLGNGSGTLPIGCGAWQAVSPNFTCTYNVNGTEVAGTKVITVTATDAAGNTSTANTSVLFDFTAPSILSAGASPSNAPLNAEIAYSLTASEPLLSVPTPVFTRSGGGTMTFAYQPSSTYTWEHLVVAGDLSGTYTPTMTLTDEVGNVSGALSGASFTVDSVVPVLSAVTLSGGAAGRYSAHAPFDVVTLTFNVSESLAAGAARAVISNDTGTLAMSCTNWKATAPNVTCTYALNGFTEAEGTRAISLEATDAAGNIGYATTSAVFDFTPPDLVSSVANPALAGLSTEIAYTIVASEPLSATPVPVFSGPGALAFAFVAGTTYTWTHLVGAGDTSGTYAPTMTLTDLVGNSASWAGSGFQVDSVAPSIAIIDVTGGSSRVYSAQTGYRSLGLQFNTGQTTAPASLSVTIANGAGTIPMVCNPWVASTPNVTCSYTVLGTEVAGVKTISIVVTDAAGNAGYGTTSVTFDFLPPSILTSVSPAIAPVGDTVAYTVTSNEPLLNVPTPAFARLDGSAPMSFAFQSGTTYQWRHVVALGDLNGTYGPNFTVSDRVGNAVSYVRTSGGMATFQVDATIPVVSSINPSRPRYSRMAGYNLLSVSFNTSEDLVDGTLSVFGDGRVMTCTARQAATPNYTCTRTVDGSDTPGAKTVSIMARDKAGNVGFGSTTVEFDFAPPTLLSTAVSVPRVKLNSTVYYTVSPSEPLAAAPTLTVTRSGGSQTLSFGHVAGTEYMYAFTSGSTNTNGTYLASVTMTDSAGNPATVSTGTASFELDVTVPTLGTVTTSGGYLGTRFSAITGFDNLVVRFNCPESVSAAPASLSATVGGATMSCSGYSTTTPNYTCSYSVPVGATSGLKTIALTARDAAGNESTASAAVEFDLVAPAVVSGSEGLEILPAASNVLSHPTKIALGTQVRVSFTATELLRASPDPVVNTDKGLSFTRFDSSGASYVYTHTLSGSPAQSVHAVRASLVDLVGNAAVANLTLPAPGFDVDTVAPGIPDVLTTDRIVYKRYPWGTTSTGSVKSFRLSGGSSAMPTGTSHVAVWDGADPATASRLGLSTVLANGSFAEFELFRADHASVYVTAVDAAGNLSASREVRDVTWTASYGGKVVGSLFENSNSAETRKVRASYLSQSGEIGVAEATATGYQNLSASDGNLLQTTAGARWRNVSYGLSPESRYGAASAYDSTRGVVTMFGGQIATGCNEGYADLCAYTWEWDGKSWMPAETTGPSPRRYASMAYDERRRKMVLFGGTGVSVSRETWEWDAVTRTWREFPIPTRGYYPSARYGAAMAYDATRGRIVLFGGYDGTGELGDTWEFDGVAWTKEATDPGTPETYPSARRYASMAYQGSGKVLLFGGYNAATCPEGGAGYYSCSYTWEWDGLAWTKRAPATSPPRRRWGGMAWDRTRGRVMLFGGYDTASLNDTWEWYPAGGTWISRGSGPAGIRYGHMMAMGPSGPVLFGGLGDSGTGCAGESADSRCPWVWTYSLTYGWRSSFVGPGIREAAAMAYDGSGTTILFGGRDAADNPKSETWQWTGTGWKKLAPTTTPTARSDHAMAYLSGYDDILMFGGRNSAGTEISETHTWAGSNWTLRSPLTVPSARKGHAIAPISTTQAILFGGVAGGVYTNSQYLWDHAGGTWTLQSITRPSSRAYHRMVYDSNRNVVVLFGGMYYSGTTWTYYNSTWEYDVATASWDQKTRVGPLDPWPTGRAYHVMVYDPDRRRTVMFGGLDADSNRLEDTWEWNGTHWSQMTMNGTTPAARILASASYDSVSKRMLLYGGTSADDLSDTWEYDSGALANPANVFSINFGAATQRPVTVRGLVVSGVGGGVGYPSGATTNGADLTVWDEGAWVQEDTNTNSESSPGSLSFSVIDLVRLGRLFIGNEKVASVSSATTAASGAGTSRGAVSTDYLQATVTYSHAHYFLSEADDTMSWTDAEAECVTRGGHLASISSAHEQSALETLLKNVNTTAWIGLGDSASEGSFVWTDGTPYSYTRWYTGEPNGGAAVDCVSMGGGSPASFYWRDDYCTVLKRYLCEFDK